MVEEPCVEAAARCAAKLWDLRSNYTVGYPLEVVVTWIDAMGKKQRRLRVQREIEAHYSTEETKE